MTEEMARSIAGQLNIKPIQPWDIREYVEKNKKALMQPKDAFDFLEEDDVP